MQKVGSDVLTEDDLKQVIKLGEAGARHMKKFLT